MISVNHVSKYFGDFRAVNDISFVIRRGEITGLLGPNGAGKTTTLRMLTCYLPPDGGRISVGGRLVDREPLEVKRMIGYLPESAPLYGDMMVRDYLSYIGRLRGVNDDTRGLRDIAEMCGIGEVMHKNIGELSKGYRQRVGLAHAMIHDPEILILDEPTSGLDPNQIVEIRRLVKEIGKRKTVVLSTHILSEVEATCDRVIIIDHGVIVADSRTAELKSAAGGGMRLIVRAGGADSASFASGLAGVPGVKTVERLDDAEGLAAASVRGEEDVDIRPGVFAAVRDSGWALYEMTTERETLEHVFRRLTRGGDDEL
jgi:ABC-2 type transport system ATP-binding protein